MTDTEPEDVETEAEAEYDLARITITRTLVGPNGTDTIYITAEDGQGDELPLLEALGLLELGRIHLSAQAHTCCCTTDDEDDEG